MRFAGTIKLVVAICALSLIAVHLSPATAAPATPLVTCVDLTSGKERISKSGSCRSTQEAQAKWHLAPSDSAVAAGGSTKFLTVCSNRETSPFAYQLIRTTCAKHMQRSLYTRSTALPVKPIISQVSSISYESASLALASDPAANLDAPIAYYTVTSSKGEITKINSWSELSLTVSGLRSSTTYIFTITATNVDGISPVSAPSLPVTTQVYVAPVSTNSAPALAAPAFTLSSIAETRTVSTTATGFTISSTGGTIANFGISATPAGMSFSTTTGALTGTPTSIQSATPYTITATNASGTATRIFTLTVSAAVYTVGQRGPGGGIVFYVHAAGTFSSGGTCGINCKYLEVAPATWQSAGVSVANDSTYVWSTNTTVLTGQDVITAGTESGFFNEKFNWKIGQGFYNTSVMKVSGATSAAQAAVLAYAGNSTAGQWFIPSMNEINELCKYARGQTTGNLTVACDSSGTLKTGTADELGGFVSNVYCSSSEYDAGNLWLQFFFRDTKGYTTKANNTVYLRPIRAF
jgi:hypothetical protein